MFLGGDEGVVLRSPREIADHRAGAGGGAGSIAALVDGPVAIHPRRPIGLVIEAPRVARPAFALGVVFPISVTRRCDHDASSKWTSLLDPPETDASLGQPAMKMAIVFRDSTKGGATYRVCSDSVRIWVSGRVLIHSPAQTPTAALTAGLPLRGRQGSLRDRVSWAATDDLARPTRRPLHKLPTGTPARLACGWVLGGHPGHHTQLRSRCKKENQ